MGRSQRPRAPPPPPVADAEKLPEKINLLDQQALKCKLDDKVIEVLVSKGYEEDVTISNLKLLLGFIAIALAVYAHFGAGPFPDNWWLVFGCVVGYLILTTVHNYFLHHQEPDAYFASKPHQENGCFVFATSHMDRFSEQYQLKLKVMAGANPSEENDLSSVERFFHEDGYLAEDVFAQFVEGVLTKCEAALNRKPATSRPG